MNGNEHEVDQSGGRPDFPVRQHRLPHFGFGLLNSTLGAGCTEIPHPIGENEEASQENGCEGQLVKQHPHECWLECRRSCPHHPRDHLRQELAIPNMETGPQVEGASQYQIEIPTIVEVLFLLNNSGNKQLTFLSDGVPQGEHKPARYALGRERVVGQESRVHCLLNKIYYNFC